MKVTVAIVGAKRVLPLRWEVLRPGLPPEAAQFEGDEDLTTWHFAAFSPQNQVVGVASYFLAPFPWHAVRRPYRLRGMATHPAYQRRAGVGRQLLTQSLAFLQRQGVDGVWCYARLEAVPFYQKMGFTWVEEAGLVDLPGVGPHRVGYLILSQRVQP
ncbi:MAG: N-acetyltransferase [Bacteroidia bacterium]|nr:MAG: N-acetyltransferase [Bacteroidia bacterium]